MMAPVPNVLRKRSVTETQITDVAVADYNDTEYLREVLQVDGRKTEAQIQDALEKEAESLGITLPRPATAKTEHNVADSSLTVSSHHARTASSGSGDSSSTGITSRSSNEFDTSWPPSRKRRSLSFSEYAKYLAQTEAQERSALGLAPPIAPTEPTPSLFSVSTRKSYASLKKGIRTRLSLRRNSSSIESLA
ncbi:hypothetical protein BGZ60DRAFT_52937 [Tricladium varicosporioides]|nr:hypothetical protein BGZ60DRAFT_52937 [Hymenoscyphus varicosporioides]